MILSEGGEKFEGGDGEEAELTVFPAVEARCGVLGVVAGLLELWCGKWVYVVLRLSVYPSLVFVLEVTYVVWCGGGVGADWCPRFGDEAVDRVLGSNVASVLWVGGGEGGIS